MKKLFVTSLFIFSFLILFSQENRTFTGEKNNIVNEKWGSKDYFFLTLTSNGYEDSIKAVNTKTRPNARLVSNYIFDQKESIEDELQLTDFIWVFGQFIDHDITLVGVDYSEPIFITVPEGDEYFTPGSKIRVFRTIAAPGTGTDINNPRRFLNEITSFIDASNVYGSDSLRARWLRTFEDGKLKMSSGNLLPWNTISGEFNDKIDPNAPELANDTHVNDKLFVAGDVRANENPLLTSFHTLFVREHNRLCDELSAKHPGWNDEQIFQRARKFVGAYLQSIVYYEWLPMQGINLPQYSGYDPNINPTISNLFSAAAFRLGHTLLDEEFLRLDNEGNEMKQGKVALKDAYFNPLLINISGGIEPFLKGMTKQVQQKLDTKIVSAVRNYLFGAPGLGGLDLAAINIMRSRERGIPDYNTIRADFSLEKVKDFSEITSNTELAQSLKFIYGNVDNIDAYVGLLAEDHVRNSIFGILLKTIMEDQFYRLREGDRFYFENDPVFSDEEKEEIKNTKFYDIIMRNTELSYMPYEVFTTKNQPIGGPEIAHLQLQAIPYPNPVSSSFRVKTWVESDIELKITLIDPAGRKILIRIQKLFEGENFIDEIDLSGYPKGIYNLILETDNEFSVLKILKQ